MINESFSLAQDLSLALDEMGVERYRVSFQEHRREAGRGEWFMQTDVFVEVPLFHLRAAEWKFREKLWSFQSDDPSRRVLHVMPLPYFACRIVSRKVAWGPRFRRALLALQRKRA